MIKLSDISVSNVLYGSESIFVNLAIKNNCYSLEDLITLMEKYPNYNWEEVQKRIKQVKVFIEKNNKNGYEPEIYEYENIGIELVDKLNSASVLLLDNPTLEIHTKYKELKTYSVNDIKQNLKLTDPWGRNMIGLLRKIGPNSFPVILNALQMYDEQVLRQAELTEKRNYNIFMKDKQVKNEIVEDLYSDIIMYLIYNTEESLVWGKLTESQKKLYISSAINSKKIDEIIKNRIIDRISNYTTLPELEKVSTGNQKVLNRFIKK